MTTLLDEVAKAIWERDIHLARINYPNFPGWDGVDSEAKNRMLADASAAIAAVFARLAEPSEGMVQAGVDAYRSPDVYHSEDLGCAIDAMWRAMLAKAKEEAG